MRVRLRAGTYTSVSAGIEGGGWNGVASTILSGPGTVSAPGSLFNVSGLSADTPTDVVLYYRPANANAGGYFYPGSAAAVGTGGTMIVEDVVAAIVTDTSKIPQWFSNQSAASPAALYAPGFQLPGTAGARINAAARSSVAMERQADGTYRYAPHNLLTYSEDFTNAAWTKSDSSVIANHGTAPNGTITADLLYPASSGDYRNARQTAAQFYPWSVQSTMSFYAKNAGLNFITVINSDGGSNGVSFNLTTGQVTVNDVAFIASSISVGNGWWRCVVSSSAGYPYVYPTDNATTNGVTANGTDGVLVWGAQLNLGPTALPYIPTTSASVFAPAVSHDGTAWGVQCEAAATNLLTYSTQFDNAAWGTNTSGITANSSIAPDGTSTADKLLSTVASEQKWVYRSVAVANGTAYTFSCYFKAAEYQYVQLRIFTTAKIADVGFTLSGAGSVFAANTGTGSIVLVGNGWYRCAVVGTSTATLADVYINCADTATLSKSFAGDGTSGVHIWGAQLETGSVATSPILTYGATATRAVDDPLTPYVPGSSGAVIIDYVPLDSSSHVVASLSDGTSNERHTVTNDGVYTVVDGGATQANPDGGTPTVGVLNKVGFAFSANDFAVALNGAAPVTDTSGTLPTVTQLSLAGGPKRVRRIRVQASKPSGAALQGMTA